ncbi:MAG: hypothetical protein E7478_09245 [Ruminococcaceae bacterium]|nr:hypothetical protein [Oscillospiraceae bacterium]
MSWINNYIAFKKNKSSGKCPKCGSDKVRVKEISCGRNSVSFFCDGCGDFRHFDECLTKDDNRP